MTHIYFDKFQVPLMKLNEDSKLKTKPRHDIEIEIETETETETGTETETEIEIGACMKNKEVI